MGSGFEDGTFSKRSNPCAEETLRQCAGKARDAYFVNVQFVRLFYFLIERLKCLIRVKFCSIG